MNQAGLLAALRDDPENDTLRLVYADWLDEHDQPARAEFIRGHVELSRQEAGSERSETLRQRLDWLHAQYKEAWLGPLAQHAPHTTFERGVVQQVTLPVGLFLQRGQELLAGHPVVRLRLTQGEGLLPALAQCPHLVGLRHLALVGMTVEVEDASALAGSPWLGGLRHLQLRETKLSLPALQVLLTSTHLGELSSLSVASNELGDEGARLVAETMALPALRRIDLSSNRITRHGALALAGSEKLGNLHTLRLAGNQLTPDDVRRILWSPTLRSLQLLDVASNSLLYRSTEVLRNEFGPRIIL
ncbi:MAG: TIGR02996 domain-containing protein [Gemmataceae bacterium]